MFRRARSAAILPAVCLIAACGQDAADEWDPSLMSMMTGSADYCSVPEFPAEVLANQPTADREPIDDVNWFARPVQHDGDEWIIAFASHAQNYIYNLSTGDRVKIPDRSDAVATPDGRYMTVPSNYTPNSNTRFYPVAPMLDALAQGRDADDLEPAFIHDHPAMHRVYYQSTSLVSEVTTDEGVATTYRLMFSGTSDESKFRIVDYVFTHDGADGKLLHVEPSAPMAICPAVENDLNTPFISKDGRYVAAHTSPTAGNAYASGASLKVFEITSTDPAAGTTSCEQVLDLGFSAGKADFSFDGSLLTFHLSQGAYLTPFVNGGLPGTTITDVAVARLEYDASGRISGHSGVQRLTSSLKAGVGSYFPAFLPDGHLFFVSNDVPRESEATKRFHFRVVDPGARGWRTRLFTSADSHRAWTELGSMWQEACTPTLPGLASEPFPLDPHELPLQAMALTAPQCEALVLDSRGAAKPGDMTDWDAVSSLCRSIEH